MGTLKSTGFLDFVTQSQCFFSINHANVITERRTGRPLGPSVVFKFLVVSLSLIYNLCCGRAIIEDLLTVALLQCTPRFLHMASTLVWRRFEYNMRRTSNIFALSYPVSLQLPSIRRLHIFIPSFSQKSINKRSSGVDVVAAIASLCCTHF